jgi:hypothetical protein
MPEIRYICSSEPQKRGGLPYTYLGRLRYLAHDRDRQQPVYFTWQILDWQLSEDVRARIRLTFESTVSGGAISPSDMSTSHGLVEVQRIVDLGWRMKKRLSKPRKQHYGQQGETI